MILLKIASALKLGGVALITARTTSDVSGAKAKRESLSEDDAWLIGTGAQERYQKGFTQAGLETYCKRILGPDFIVGPNKALNGASVIIRRCEVA